GVGRRAPAGARRRPLPPPAAPRRRPRAAGGARPPPPGRRRPARPPLAAPPTPPRGGAPGRPLDRHPAPALLSRPHPAPLVPRSDLSCLRGPGRAGAALPGRRRPTALAIPAAS